MNRTAYRALAGLHRVLGLTLVALLLTASTTGAVVAFDDELERWLLPAWHAAGTGRALPVDALVARVESGLPDCTVRQIRFAREAGRPAVLYVDPDGTRCAHSQVYVAPSTGAVLGARTCERSGLDRVHLVPTLYRLHAELLLPGETGSWVRGLSAIGWLLTAGAGLYLAWPRGRRWRSVLVPTQGAHGVRAAFEWHRASALWLLGPTLVIASSGLALTLPDAVFRPAVGWAAAFGPPLPAAVAARTAENRAVALGWDAALATARAHAERHFAPIRALDGARLDRSRATYRITYLTSDDPDVEIGHSRVYVAADTGEILATAEPRHRPPGEVVEGWLVALHGGTAFGVVGRSVIAVLGVALTVSLGAGVRLWWRRRQLRKRP